MSYVMVDIEADGPIPEDYSIVCSGSVIVGNGLQDTFSALKLTLIQGKKK